MAASSSRFLLKLLLLFVPLLAIAQYTTGNLEGSITDASGSPVANAKAVVTNPDLNISREFVTAEDGAYWFTALAPGLYQVRIQLKGFQELQGDVRVNASQTTSRNFDLQVATQQNQVEVVGSATPDLHVADALRENTFGIFGISNLPNASRNIVNMIVIAPGVTPTFNPRGGNLTTLSIAQAGQMNVNGGRSKASSTQLDFTDANDWEFGGIALATQPTPDMLQSFQILTNNWQAEYGTKASGEVLMITKSGSNALHGTTYDFLQNAALNSRDYFDRTGSATPLRQNYFGFTAGGTVWKDHTFLFGGYEGRRTRGAGSTFLASVPTAQARATAVPAVSGLLTLLPLPTSSAPGALTGTLAIQATSPSDSDQFLLRGDHYFSQRSSLTVRYYQNLGTSVNRTANSLPGFDATFDPRGRNAMIAHNWVIGPRSTNELRLGYGRSSALFSPETDPATPRFGVTGLVGFGTVQSWPQGRVFNVYQMNDAFSTVRGAHSLKAGVDFRYIQDNSINDSNRRGVFTFPSVSAFLQGQLSGWTQAFGNTYRGFRMQYHGAFVQDDWKATPSLSLNFGLRYEYQGGLSENHSLQSVLDGRLTQSIGQAGTGALGAFRTASPAVESNPYLFAPRFGFAWNPRSGRLVVRGGYGMYFDSLTFNGLQAGRTTPPSNYTGALSIFNSGNTLTNLLAGTAPAQVSFASQIGGFGSLRNFGSITSQIPNTRNPYVQQFSLGMEYRLANSAVIDVSYVGTEGTYLPRLGPANSAPVLVTPAASLADEQARLAQFTAALNSINSPAGLTPSRRLDSRFNDVSLITDDSSSSYHSLQVQVRRQVTSGLEFGAAYSWSKSIDNASDFSPGQATTDRSFAQNQFDLRNERAVSAFDIPHRFTLTHVWAIPAFRSGRGLLAQALGGWTFSSINQWQTGIPYTVMSGARLGISDVNLDGNGSGTLDNVRANCVAAGAGFSFGNPATIPSAAARGVGNNPNSANFQYTQPLLGNNGTCGRNTERMNNLLNFDWTFSKQFRLLEHGPLQSGPYGLEFRADLFNIFNVPFLTAAGDDFRNVASPVFGQYNAAGAARRIQLALRLSW